MEEFVRKIPKAEIHMHLEGSMTPETIAKLAQKNNIVLPISLEEIAERRLNFQGLSTFIYDYGLACSVIRSSEDFYEVAMDYFEHCHEEGIVYTETFFSSANHPSIPFADVFEGLQRASAEAEARFGLKSRWILNIIRHLPLETNLTSLRNAAPYREAILGLGFAGAEVQFPATSFVELFDEARKMGFENVTVHTGEEGDPTSIIETLYSLRPNRIDHGVRALEDKHLLEFLKKLQIPLTLSPLSNKCLKINERFFGGRQIVKELMDHGLLVSINSDDPAFFGGGIGKNFMEIVGSLGESEEEQRTAVAGLCKNSFKSSFLAEEQKVQYCEQVDSFLQNFR